ncbi:MAG: sigma-70 family RNA polymerase sigma factor [Planctomycetes bacterium]|nr:sigma-70 family RNA polymerase sigma factor [Planctomycetota bacterium]
MLSPEAWVDQYGDYLFRYALLRVRNSTIASDLVQETFLAGLRSMKDFSGRSSERTWLIAILKHKIVDHYREINRGRSAREDISPNDSCESAFTETGEWKVIPAEWDLDPAKAFEQKEFWEVFHHCLSGLPGRLADAFSLRELEGLSTDEVCRILGVTATNLAVMFYRARMKLRSCLETHWFAQKPRGNS